MTHCSVVVGFFICCFGILACVAAERYITDDRHTVFESIFDGHNSGQVASSPCVCILVYVCCDFLVILSPVLMCCGCCMRS